jgi:MerR family redox-sensitive transcriptional activator SoxR
MKTKPVQGISPHPDRAGHAATSTALQVKRALTIGTLARSTGLRPSAIRYYERLGLVPAAPRRSGWREYGADDIRRLKRLVAIRRLGFSLRQLGALDSVLSDRRALAAALTAKAADLKTRIESLQRAHATIAALLACDCDDTRTCENMGESS